MKKIICLITVLLSFALTTFAGDNLPFKLKGDYKSVDDSLMFTFIGDTLTISYTDSDVISTYKLRVRSNTSNRVVYDAFELYADAVEGYRQAFIIITKGYNYQLWKDYWIEYRGVDKGDTYSNIDKAYIRKVLK